MAAIIILQRNKSEAIVVPIAKRPPETGGLRHFHIGG
jgi:hypothetical protein